MQKVTSKLFDRAIFIFRRDLRLEDNTGLLNALRQSNTVIPCFILDNNQLDTKRNQYFSHNLVQFMAESLKDLNSALQKHDSRLYLFNGEIESVIRLMIESIKPHAIFTNEDVTPYAIKRDATIAAVCKRNNIQFFSTEDMMLHSKNQALMSNGQFFQKFTPYYQTASRYPIAQIQPNPYNNYIPAENKFPEEFSIEKLDALYTYNPHLEINGGRVNGLELIRDLDKQSNYPDTRNILTLSTSRLSAYNKFGCVSIREVYKKIREVAGEGSALVKQLYWRDFFYGVMYHYPHVVGNAMKPEYDNLEWNVNKEDYERWCKGQTGCPIVDAGIRQLNTTGYISNRMRLIVGSYLVKTLMIDWRLGEKHFSKYLVDCDISQNNGGWQWLAGSGCDTQPYVRVFNPIVQSEKFDADCKYILKWVPELQTVKKNHIHRWEDFYQQYKGKVDYPAPIVRHEDQRDKVVKMYERIVGKPHSTLGIHPENRWISSNKVKPVGESRDSQPVFDNGSRYKDEQRRQKMKKMKRRENDRDDGQGKQKDFNDKNNQYTKDDTGDGWQNENKENPYNVSKNSNQAKSDSSKASESHHDDDYNYGYVPKKTADISGLDRNIKPQVYSGPGSRSEDYEYHYVEKKKSKNRGHDGKLKSEEEDLHSKYFQEYKGTQHKTQS